MEAPCSLPVAGPTRVALPGLPVRYQVLRTIGAGGSGTVFLARDRRAGRLVALKTLRHPGERCLERLRREARLLERLSHPAIVAVREFEVHAGRAYLAMDYVDGGNLAHARLEPRALVRALRRIVDALAHAHRLGVVHRDVKPENVLLDRSGRAYLADFGLALERSARAFTPAAGTPLTMSPEQARGGAVGPASDLFSFGVTLQRSLTGEWPFLGRTLADVLHAIQHDEPRSAHDVRAAVPRALHAIVRRCLEKEPERRFASADALGRALDRFLAPPSFLARMLRARGRASVPRIHPYAPCIHPEDDEP